MCKKPVSGRVVIIPPAPYPAGGCANGFIRVPGGRKSFISLLLYLYIVTNYEAVLIIRTL